MPTSSITCLVPTHNRPQFLRRLLKFYGQFPPGFAISVVDSSRSDAAAENVAAVQASPPELSVDYRHFDLDLISKGVRALERVETPFVAFCADDDVLFPDAVRRCVEFLETEPGFSSAMGRTAVLKPKLPSWCCQVLRGYSIEDDRPFERCRQLAANWLTNFYAVYRTETLLDMFQITAANTNSALNYHIPEMLLSQLSALRGRIKVLPLMYSLMERHGTNTGSAMRVGIRPQAELLYQRFRGCLADQFVQAGIDRAEAERFIDEAYGYFRDPNLAIRRRPRSTAEAIGHFFHGIAESAAGLLGTNFNKHLGTEFNRHRRLVRASDLVGCEPIWHAAVQLIRDFPLGIPADHSKLQRCA